MTAADVERTAALRAAVLEQRPVILDVTHYVHEHPELAHEEVRAADRITTALDNFEIERPFAGMAGAVTVFGRPADELVSPRAIAEGSGKAVAVERGGFDGIDAVLYFHPGPHTGVWRSR